MTPAAWAGCWAGERMEALRKIFDQAAAGYDELRSRVIPCFEDFYGTIVRLIPHDPGHGFRVLDLGAGTGLVTAVIRTAFPHSAITAVDQSEGMLAKLRGRFAGDDQVSAEIMDYGAGPLPPGQDLIVSALSIHHLDQQGKRRLFAALLGALKPGGLFINADLVRGASQRVEDFYQGSWRRHLEASGIPRPELDAIYQRMRYDLTDPLEAQLTWLRVVGFVDVDSYYQYNNFAVYAGSRPAEAGRETGIDPRSAAERG